MNDNTYANTASGTAPEDEILEGIIVEDEPAEAALTVQTPVKYSPDATVEELEENYAEIHRVAKEARSYKADSLEETTANIENLKKLLGRFL